MAKVKIVSLDGARNTKINYPVVGVIEHDSNGVAEIDEEHVEELLKRRSDHVILETDYKEHLKNKMIKGDHKKPVKIEISIPGSKPLLDLEAEEEDDQQRDTKKTPIGDDEFRASLMGETKLSLAGMCEDMDCPTAEYKDLKKSDLIEYVINKTKENN